MLRKSSFWQPLSFVMMATLVMYPVTSWAIGTCASLRQTDAINEACSNCVEGSCSGQARVINPYSACNFTADTGSMTCTYNSSNMINAGETKVCVVNTSYWGVLVCFGGACAAGLGACMVSSIPCAGAGPAYFGCLAACCAVAGTSTAIACCMTSCYCVDSCDPGDSTPYLVPTPVLSGGNCPAS